MRIISLLGFSLVGGGGSDRGILCRDFMKNRPISFGVFTNNKLVKNYKTMDDAVNRAMRMYSHEKTHTIVKNSMGRIITKFENDNPL